MSCFLTTCSISISPTHQQVVPVFIVMHNVKRRFGQTYMFLCSCTKISHTCRKLIISILRLHSTTDWIIIIMLYVLYLANCTCAWFTFITCFFHYFWFAHHALLSLYFHSDIIEVLHFICLLIQSTFKFSKHLFASCKWFIM